MLDQNLQKEKNQNKELEEVIHYILTLLVRGKTKLEDQYDNMEIKLQCLQNDEKTNKRTIRVENRRNESDPGSYQRKNKNNVSNNYRVQKD